jgi:hypothetical protein
VTLTLIKESGIQKLKNQSAFFVEIRIFDGFEISDSVIKRLLSELACISRALQNFKIAHGEVQSKAKTNRMGRGQRLLSDGQRLHIIRSSVFEVLRSRHELSLVTIIISRPDPTTKKAERKEKRKKKDKPGKINMNTGNSRQERTNIHFEIENLSFITIVLVTAAHKKRVKRSEGKKAVVRG